jgi:hypothetical protein
MNRLKIGWVATVAIVIAVVAFASYRYGSSTQREMENQNLAHVQATLSFAHYKTIERLESLLQRKCYEGALAEVGEFKKAQLVLLSENFRASGNDAELTEYIKTRDSKLLETIVSGPIPELKPFTAKCP